MTGKHDNTRPTGETVGKLFLSDRRHMEITAVEDVISFDENGAVLRTTPGMLAIEGEGLHVIRLDPDGGTLLLEGKINGLFYSEAGAAKKRSGRFFR